MYPETRLSSEFGDGTPIGWQAGEGEAIQYFESEDELRRNINTPKLDPNIKGPFRMAFASTAPGDTELFTFAKAIPAMGSCDGSVA